MNTGRNANTARNTSQLLRSRTGCTLIQLQISPRAVFTQKNRAHIPHDAQLTQLTLLLRLKIATRIHVRRNRSTKSTHTKNSEVNILLGMQILLHATFTPHGGLRLRIVEERGNREVNSLRIISIHQLPQQRTQVRNTRMVRVTGTVHLYDSHALQRAARQMTRDLSHSRTPRHTQARSIINQGIKESRRGTGYLTHTGNGGSIRTHIHESNAHLIALTDAALKLAAGTEGII